MTLFVVEHRFDPPLDATQAPKDMKTSPCVQTNDIQWLGTLFARDGTRCMCMYEAPDGDAVRLVYRTAKIPFAAVWPAAHYQP